MAFKLFSGVLLVTLLAYVNSASLGCKNGLEVVAVVDGSDSILKSEFLQLKTALIDLASRLNLNSGLVRFGVVLYSSKVNQVINLSNDLGYLIDQINNLPHPREATNTHLGIASMINVMLSQGRTNVDRIGIVITDGVSKDEAATSLQAALAKNNGITMYSVGVGLNREQGTVELENIASSSNKAIDIQDYSRLGVTLKNLLPNLCPTPTPTPTAITTTITTTPRPSITTDTTRTTISQDADSRLCEGCVMPNGIGFIGDKDNCHRFIQCTEDQNGNLKALIKDCPGLTVWDDSTLTCNYPNLVACKNDPCKIPGNLFYKKSTNCRNYYQCNDAAAMPLCCDQGKAFNAISNRCEFDQSCQDACLGEDAEVKSTTCIRSPSKQGYYMEDIVGTDKKRERPCPVGTSFNQTTCDCTNMIGLPLPSDPNVNTQCKAEVNIPFDNGVVKDIASGNWVENLGVTVENGIGYFDGSSGLRILRFSNVALGSTFRIKMRYRVDGNINGQQALVTNRDCGKDGTISIILDRTSTSFGMSTEAGQKIDVPVSVSQQDQWQELEFDLKDGQLSGTVGSSPPQEKPASGGIGLSECALQIGRGTTFENFKGYIDYIEIYMC